MKIYTLHSVADNGLSLSVKDFTSFVRHLKRSYRVINADEFCNGDWNDQCAMLTFDDCFSDNFTNALPILTAFQIPATFFCAIGYANKIMWGSVEQQRWAEEKSDIFNIPFSFMSIEELKVLKQLGHEIGCHTYSHRNLDELSEGDQKYEIFESKKELEYLMQSPIRFFAYPRGRYNTCSLDCVASAGYDFGFSTRASECSKPSISQDKFSLPRLPVAKKRFSRWL
ncbi:polysaccharide deacetylase family protein [bacterium]|nr:polysaccharide deacetylase family protein [bacterium]